MSEDKLTIGAPLEIWEVVVKFLHGGAITSLEQETLNKWKLEVTRATFNARSITGLADK